MPVVRINARGEQPSLHNSPQPVWDRLSHVLANTLPQAPAHTPEDTTATTTGSGPVSEPMSGQASGPVIVMIHGFKYLPGHRRHCPHRHILSLHPQDTPWRVPSWPRQLGFGTGHRNEGLAIAFGWEARGALWQAQKRAVQAGRALAKVIARIKQRDPRRPVHVVAHSMGTELALEALHHLPAGGINRILSLTGASYSSRVYDALETPAGRSTEFINITSRENDPFDFLFERLITPPCPGDRAMGFGIDAPNAVTVQLDCAGTLDHLDRLGAPIAQPKRRVCHWSSYTRPGVLQFYNDLLRRPDHLPLRTIRSGLPGTPDPRWSRLVTRPSLPKPQLRLQRTG